MEIPGFVIWLACGDSSRSSLIPLSTLRHQEGCCAAGLTDSTSDTDTSAITYSRRQRWDQLEAAGCARAVGDTPCTSSRGPTLRIASRCNQHATQTFAVKI